MPYELEPRYPTVGARVASGYGPLVSAIAQSRPVVLALDGPGAVDWTRFTTRLADEARRAGVSVEAIDVRRFMAPWPEVERRTESDPLRSDPVFAKVFDGSLEAVFGEIPRELKSGADVTLVFGPGSAFARHDLLWFVDVPKRLSLTAIEEGRAGNLGQPAETAGTLRRLLFIDWPMEDRHRRRLAERWHFYVDLSDPERPRSVDGTALRLSLQELVRGPFRTRPTFQRQPWGGRWMRDVLGVPADEWNLGLGFELITPESGIVLGDGDGLEVSFEVLLALEARALLGDEVRARFGPSFPIRFDYLDTVDGGNLSVHCHPRQPYMREVFGLPYEQQESYYVVKTRADAVIFLGLHDEVDVEPFREAAHRSQSEDEPLAIERFVRTFPAVPHQLYLIPAGTPHASGEGNVVLEISSTPYLYSLRFYDWLRADLGGALRPVQLEHAFANLDPERRGARVERELVPTPEVVRRGEGFVEELIGRHPDLFFAVHRLNVERPAEDDTAGRFHVLALVEGDSVEVETAVSRHPLSYGETLIVPACVGAYRISPVGAGPHKVVKAFVAPE
jgi:mannose-6-phosphate isomerase class I